MPIKPRIQGTMNKPINHKSLCGFGVHFLTASGAVFAMLALLAAVEKNWEVMFWWLVIAFAVDGIDGPLARRFEVKKNAAKIDGELLDLIIDYLTYVFIPAFALFESGLLPGWTGWVVIFIITYTSAIYFADTRMKTRDSSFSGFPACWNMLTLVLFVMQPNFWLILAIVTILAISMFIPLRFIHPVRTKRWRKVSLPITAVWVISAAITTWGKDDYGAAVYIILFLSSCYLLFAGITQQIFAEVKRYYRNKNRKPQKDI